MLRTEKVAYRCRLSCQDHQHISEGVSSIHRDHFGFAYGTADIMCPIPSGCETPSNITVTSAADKSEGTGATQVVVMSEKAESLFWLEKVFLSEVTFRKLFLINYLCSSPSLEPFLLICTIKVLLSYFLLKYEVNFYDGKVLIYSARGKIKTFSASTCFSFCPSWLRHITNLKALSHDWVIDACVGWTVLSVQRLRRWDVLI